MNEASISPATKSRFLEEARHIVEAAGYSKAKQQRKFLELVSFLEAAWHEAYRNGASEHGAMVESLSLIGGAPKHLGALLKRPKWDRIFFYPENELGRYLFIAAVLTITAFKERGQASVNGFSVFLGLIPFTLGALFLIRILGTSLSGKSFSCLVLNHKVHFILCLFILWYLLSDFVNFFLYGDAWIAFIRNNPSDLLLAPFLATLSLVVRPFFYAMVLIESKIVEPGTLQRKIAQFIARNRNGGHQARVESPVDLGKFSNMANDQS